jgi:hypothetical protein
MLFFFMIKLNHDSELFTSHRHQWWPCTRRSIMKPHQRGWLAEVSKPQWAWRSGRSQVITREDRGGRAGHGGEGGAVVLDLAEEAKQPMVKMALGGAEKDGLGRWRCERGEDGLGAAAWQTYQQVYVDMTSSLNGAAGGVSINNQWWTYYKEKITPSRNTPEL